MPLPSSVLAFALALFSGLAACSGCAAAAIASAEYFDANPNAAFAKIPANITYDCISSIPVQKDYSEKLPKSMRAWIELDSKLDYLKRPFTGYLWDPIDVLAEFDRIASSLDNYAGQYDFEMDLQTLGVHCHDGHTGIQGSIATNLATWDRGFNLISVSKDGLEEPEVYLSSDAVELDAQNNLILKSNTSISPVRTINELPVQTFLQTQQLVARSHDPDSMYNQLFLSIPQSANPDGSRYTTFTSPVFYPGPETVLRFENGSHYTRTTWTAIKCMPKDITTGQEYWDACVYPEGNVNTTTAMAMSASSSSPSDIATVTARAAPSITQIASHPVPVVIGPGGLLSGYFIDTSGYDDVAVLVIRSFGDGGLDSYLESFQASLKNFLGQARDGNRTKLIIDLQGNGGGLTDAGIELVAQLFPNVPPDQKRNFRASAGYEIILEKIGSFFGTRKPRAQ